MNLPHQRPIPTISHRIFAYLFDAILLTINVFAFHWVDKSLNDEIVVMISTLAVIQFNWIYEVGMHAIWGKTIGKWMMGIRVVRFADGVKISWTISLLRFLPYFLLLLLDTVLVLTAYTLHFADRQTLTIAQFLQTTASYLTFFKIAFFIADTLTTIFHPERRSIHDLIAGTVVVRDDRSLQGPPATTEIAKP